MHGVAGSGKSTLVRECGLVDYSINPDAYRLEMAGVKIDDYGNEVISNLEDRAVWARVYYEIQRRMQRGDEIIILDATNLGSLSSYKRWAKTYGYNLILVDFQVSLEELLRRNTIENRNIAYIPDEVTKKMYERKKRQDISGFCVISPEEFASYFVN